VLRDLKEVSEKVSRPEKEAAAVWRQHGLWIRITARQNKGSTSQWINKDNGSLPGKSMDHKTMEHWIKSVFGSLPGKSVDQKIMKH